MWCVHSNFIARINNMDDENLLRGKLIFSALQRAERAYSQGFYLEVLALCDSLIGDRIVKIANYSVDESLSARGVNDWLKRLQSKEVTIFDNELIDDTRAWGKLRNAAIHGFSKFDEFEGASWRARLAQIQLPAREGISIAKRWLKEAKRHKI